MEESNNSKTSKDFILSIEEAQECLRIANILQVHEGVIKSEREDIIARVTEAKKFIAKKADLLNFLQKLQVALQQKSIDVFSQLLTYFVKDVLKKDDKEIKLDLYTLRGMPALKIEANNNGMPENIYDGNGGSITNIVSAGLRLIALSRLSHRKFIVLDEPDCWMEVRNVPLFTKTISEIANKLKIQTVMVSHYKDAWKLIKDSTRVIELKKEGNMLVTSIINDVNPEIDENLNYIKIVRLQQTMSHTDTIYELSPYMNCVVGENDIGKSVFSTVLKAVSYNDSNDSIIQHHRSIAKALIELSNGDKILWERTRETGPDFPQKVRYSLYKNDGTLTQEYNSEDVPKFIKKELNMAIVEDIDVHINHQKEPVFLLGNSVKPQDKAKILSLGKESIMIQKLMELVRVKTRTNNAIIKNGEEKFDLLNKQIVALDGTEQLIEQLNNVKNKLQNHLYHLKEKESLSNDIENLKIIQSLNNLGKIKLINNDFRMKPVRELINDINQLLILKNYSMLEKIEYKELVFNSLPEKDLKLDIKRLKVLEGAISLKKIEIVDFQLAHKNTKDLLDDINKLKYLKSVKTLTKIKDTLVNFDIKNSDSLKRDMEQLKVLNDTVKKWKDSAKKGELIKKKIEEQIEEFLKDNNSICSTCGQTIDKKHFGVEHE